MAETLIGTTTTDKCSVCGAEMAPDQHYCVECGTRRGKPRFTLDNAGAPRKATAAAASGSPRPKRALSANATLLAGLSTLLIALMVGFLIGRVGQQTPRNASTVVLNDSGAPAAGSSAGTANTGAASSTTAASSTASGSSKTGSSTKASAAKTAKVAATPKVQAAANAASNKTLGTSNGVKIASPTTTVGGSCTAGSAGCTGGKFTGNFFGG